MNCNLETSIFLSQLSPKVPIFILQVFKMLIYGRRGLPVFCVFILLSLHVCDTLLDDSVGVLWLSMDWVCRTHLTLKAYQLHSGWQPPYPQSIIPTKRRSSCWANHALSVLLKGHFNISIYEWIALNCLTQHNTPRLSQVFKCQGDIGLQNNSSETVWTHSEQIKLWRICEWSANDKALCQIKMVFI